MTATMICLMGPTAAGKTDLACQLVERFPLEIISVDSAMIYREMDIGTAKPEPDILARAPHHLLDIISPVQSYSAAQFCADVKRLETEIRARGRTPLLVGGTMMYYHALQYGLSDLPEADPVIRQSLIDRAALQGNESLYDELSRIDPTSASRIHVNDTQRLIRALEVYHQTGTSFSELQTYEKNSEPRTWLNLGLMPEDRAWLHARIETRFVHMIADGLIDEVRGLCERWPLHAELPSMRSVGYRQVYSYLQGIGDEQEMMNKGVAATRQLAKRQLTWLRHWPEMSYFDPQDAGIEIKIMEKIQQMLDNA